MPASRESYEASQEHRRAQLRVRAGFMAEFAQLWPVLFPSGDNRTPTPDTIRAWLRLSITLIRRWQTPSRALALDYYDRAHRLDLGSPAPRPPRIPEMPEQQIIRNLVGRGPGELRRLKVRGIKEAQAEIEALERSMSSGARLVLDGGRAAIEEAVKADRTALGFMRVSDGDPCYFCAMLVSRGAVYESQDTAGRSVNNRFLGPGLFKFHDHCGCTVAPVFTREEFVYDEGRQFRSIWDQTYGKTGVTHSGNTVAGVDYFRAVLEGRATLPE